MIGYWLSGHVIRRAGIVARLRQWWITPFDMRITTAPMLGRDAVRAEWATDPRDAG